MRAGVPELDPEGVALGRTDHGARRGAVVHPRREEDTRCDFELDVRRGEGVLADPSGPRREGGWWVEERVEVLRTADGGNLVAEHRGMSDGAADVARVIVADRLRIAVEGELAHDRDSGERCRRCDQLPTGESSFRHG